MDELQPTTRDERILAVLSEGESSTAVIAAAAELPERTVRAGLAHLRKEGLVVAPERGRYRLTAVGRTVSEDLLADPGPLRPVPASEPQPDVAVAASAPDDVFPDEPETAAGIGPGLAGVAGFALGVAATLTWTFLRQTPAATPPPAPVDPWAVYRRPW